MNYNPREIESKWQKYWEDKELFRADDFSTNPKKYIMVEFPYPSGDGLHVGHARSYSALDAVARKKRMEGYNVLYPMGWDAFGLPAENYAIKHGIHPKEAISKNIANFKRQMKSLGISFDWSREINTTDPKYYKWTQWIFLKLLEKDMAYQAEMPINWCPSCKIGLANEEVVAGKCERCGTETLKKILKQWMLKITAYADRLIDDLEMVDYPDKVKSQQIHWIGKSFGAEVDFKLNDSDEAIKVFTTRIDTLFGVTAVVLAPEHNLISVVKDKIENIEEVKKYIEASAKKSEFERTELLKEKTGVELKGVKVINPINNEKVPVWVGDYVIATYGGGAVMMVPAHDYRDFDFAKKYNVPIKKVILPPSLMDVVRNAEDIAIGAKSQLRPVSECFVDDGELVNSGEFSGLKSEEAREKITYWLEDQGFGKKTVQYKLRDWIFSRQHYWGEPIPVIHCKKCGIVPVLEEDLPVELPYVEKYQPTGTGESPLAAIKEWVNVKCPKCAGPAERETDTMPNWAGSNWYYMRYCDPDNADNLAEEQKLKYWLPVDWYNGGFEHTTLHLLYSRFIFKFLFDLNIAPQPEPYRRRTSHGIVLGEDNRKMSKSFGNVINPDEIIAEYGADTLRLYEMFMGPFDQAISWNNQGVKGVARFLEKFWRLAENCNKDQTDDQEIIRALNRLNKKIDTDIEQIKFNTIIAYFMECVNLFAEKKDQFGKDSLGKLIILLSPFAPHISEEIWRSLGHDKTVFAEKWPEADESFLKEDKVKMVIQVNGKPRDVVDVDAGLSEKDCFNIAISNEKVNKFIGGSSVKKTIFVQDKLINIVI